MNIFVNTRKHDAANLLLKIVQYYLADILQQT